MINRFYFIPILVILFTLLLLIPTGVLLENILLAKVSGFLTLVLTIVAIRYWFFILRKKNNRSQVIKLTTNDIFLLKQKFPFVNGWSSHDLAIICGRIGVSMAEVRFIRNGQDVSREQALISSFIVAMKFMKEDILPIANQVLAEETLDEIKERLIYNRKLSFLECVSMCEAFYIEIDLCND